MYSIANYKNLAIEKIIKFQNKISVENKQIRSLRINNFDAYRNLYKIKE